jgi:hypothetical protein
MAKHVNVSSEESTVFVHAIDERRGLAVGLFSREVADVDLWAFAKALAEFDARVTTPERPALVLINESTAKACADEFPAKRRTPLHHAKVTTLLAVVTPRDRGELGAVTWILGDRYVPFPAASFQEAVAWIEERRDAALFPFLEGLLNDVRAGSGPATAR